MRVKVTGRMHEPCFSTTSAGILSGESPWCRSNNRYFWPTTGTRTRDLFVTNEMLYRLSYCGDCGAKVILLRIPTNSLAYFFRCNHIFFSPDSPDGFRIGRSTLSSKRANRLTLRSLHSQYPLLKTKRRNELHRPASCCAYIIDRLFGFLPAVSQLQSDMVHVDFGQRRSRDVGNYVGHHLLLVVRVVVIAAAR